MANILTAYFSMKGQTIVSTPFKNVIFRRNGMSFFAGQHTGVYSLNH